MVQWVMLAEQMALEQSNSGTSGVVESNLLLASPPLPPHLECASSSP